MNHYLQGAYAPVAHERAISDLTVRGQLPRGLCGTFFRNGPNPSHVFSDRYHWFDGDGMVHALTFDDGRARYLNRWIRTARFEAQQAADRALFAGMRDSRPSDPSVAGMSANPANTPCPIS